ncbi:MAG: anthranilate phosphoribosyltransferase [Ignavibacteriaceae bacterium]|nr:anthranilate phosphoribosyltransferase [Ignavibacteriaceae bacterium]
MIKELIEKLTEKINLSFNESFNLMNEIMDGKLTDAQLAGILIALKSKGESPEEIAGFAKAMRERSIKISNGNNAIDVCGTGGDNSGTFNISTAVAFVVAGAGIRVAKHGNRSITSRSGSADVLESLGININIQKEKAEKALEKIGITFLFAPHYHPAMKNAANARKELAVKTIFNILGPLTNPAGVKRQLIGAFNSNTAKKMSEALNILGTEKSFLYCCDDRYDEILLSGKNEIFESAKGNSVRKFHLENHSFGYPAVDLDSIRGESAQTNAQLIQDLLDGNQKNGAFHTVCANAALALFCMDYSDDLIECVKAAEESILSGASKKKLEQLRRFSNED